MTIDQPLGFVIIGNFDFEIKTYNNCAIIIRTWKYLSQECKKVPGGGRIF